jgi:hypothetical protein
MTRSAAHRSEGQWVPDYREPINAAEDKGDDQLLNGRVQNINAQIGFGGFDPTDPHASSRWWRASTHRDQGYDDTRTDNQHTVIDCRHSAAQVVPHVLTAERRQAEHFSAILDEQRAQIDHEITDRLAALARCQDRGDLRAVRRMRRRLAHKFREQFELDRLRERLEHRFFPEAPKRIEPRHYFDITITRNGSRWSVHIPELDVLLTNIHHRADAEIMGHAYIAAMIGTPMAEIAVRFAGE